MKKKVLALLLASTMVASMAACGNEEGSNSSAPESSNSGAAQNSSSDANTPAPAEDYVLDKISVVVNGTVNAIKTDGAQDAESTAAAEAAKEAFIDQLEAGIEARMGYHVDLEFTQLDHSKYVDAVGRLFVSGDYPDVMIMSAEMYKQYAPTGLLWDMAEAYDNAEFQSRMELPGINEAAKDSEGHLYGFAPTYGNGCITYIKQTWLDAVGINGDSIKTYDDYYNMLLAFHNGDPDGDGTDGNTYGVISAGFYGTEAPYINYVPEFWQGAYPGLLQDADGVWYDGFATDDTKAALERLRQAYVDGAIDPVSFTAGTKDAREKWFSADQAGSSGAFTYWAGNWFNNLNNKMVENGLATSADVDANKVLYELAPIKEITDTIGGYINREAPVWVIIDNGDEARCQAVFDAFLDTMLDGDVCQTLWTYGAEDVHWSTHAEEFVLNADDPDKRKEYSYEEGTFHYTPSVTSPTTAVNGKNHLDPALVIAPISNGLVDLADLEVISNQFFTSNCVDAPVSPSSETFSEQSGTITDAIKVCISDVVIDGVDVDTAMDKYISTVGSIVETCLAELNAAE
ncbi:MAG: hypothetical protein NC417_05180 [Candidatus Gastranaerophilales bacterium]|nr:hypothetical protein [Candidatus Gastranaerophilales bacterium]